MAELGERLARTRLERNLSQQQVATTAGVSKRTVERLEAGSPVQLTAFIRVMRVLGLLEGLNALVPEPLPNPIEQVKLQGHRRRRAAPRAQPRPATEPWSWGDPPDGDAR
jgi:transcriptional regulator with XRE-family HTH domain